MNEITKVEASDNLLPNSGTLSLSLPDGLPFDRWQDIGRELAAREKVLNWWIGDWWAFGEHEYGERAKAAAENIFPLTFQALADCGSVARAFETSRRREVVSFSAHRELAPIARANPDAAEALLDLAEQATRENRPMTKAELREIARELRNLPAPVRNERPAPDNDSLLSGFLHHWNRLPRAVRIEAAKLIAAADGEEIEPA